MSDPRENVEVTWWMVALLRVIQLALLLWLAFSLYALLTAGPNPGGPPGGGDDEALIGGVIGGGPEKPWSLEDEYESLHQKP